MEMFSDEALDRFDREEVAKHEEYAVRFKGFNFGARMLGLMKMHNIVVEHVSQVLTMSFEEADSLLGLEEHPKTLTLCQTFALASLLSCSRQFLFLGIATPRKSARPTKCNSPTSSNLDVSYEYRSFR